MIIFRNRVGLSISPNSVKVIKVRETGQGIELLAAAISEVEGKGSEENGLLQAIAEGLKSVNVRPEQVSIIGLEAPSIIRYIELPPLEKKEIAQAINWEIDKYIPLNKEEVIFDWQLLEREGGTGKLKVLLIAVKKEIIDNYLPSINKAGLRPRKITLNSLAPINLFLRGKEHKNVTALISLRNEGTALSILDGEKLKFSEDFPQVNSTSDEGLKRLLPRLKRSLHYYNVHSDGQKVEEVIVPPEITGNSQSIQALEDELGIKVRCRNLLNGIRIDSQAVDRESIGASLPRLEDAIGLTMNGTIKIDLTPQSIKEALESRKRRMALFMTGVSLTFLFLIAFMGAKAKGIRLTREVAASPSSLRRSELLASNKELERKVSILSNIIAGSPHWSSLLSDLIDELPKDLWLTKLNKEESLTISGLSLSPQSVVEFISNLNSSPHFSHTRLQNMREEEIKGRKVVSFTITSQVQ